MHGMVLRKLTAREILMPWCKKFLIMFFFLISNSISLERQRSITQVHMEHSEEIPIREETKNKSPKIE
jgi:hypothetical protein